MRTQKFQYVWQIKEPTRTQGKNLGCKIWNSLSENPINGPGCDLVVGAETYSYAHNKPIVCPFMKQNEVYLTGKNLTISCSWPLDFCYTFVKGLDLSMLKIWGLLVKGLQSYQLSKLEVT